MTDFSNYVLITDLDGTLLPYSKIVSDKDLAAIERYKNGGGIFTIATGRIYQAAEQYFDILKPNAPVLLNNGGLIYDINKSEALYSCYLDTAAIDYTLSLMEQFPEIGVEINTMENIYVVRMTEWERKHLEMTHINYTEKTIDDVKNEKWCKVLYSIEGNRMYELENYVQHMGWNKTNFTASGEFLFECLPLDCSKGSALKKLVEINNFCSHTIVAAGDYDNDITMLEYADIGIAPFNAQDIVKKTASYVTKATCENGAIAEAIEYIEKVCKVK